MYTNQQKGETKKEGEGERKKRWEEEKGGEMD